MTFYNEIYWNETKCNKSVTQEASKVKYLIEKGAQACFKQFDFI